MSEVAEQQKLLSLSDHETNTITKELKKILENAELIKSDKLEQNRDNLALNLMCAMYENKYNKETTLKIMEDLNKLIECADLEKIATEIYSNDKYLDVKATGKLVTLGLTALEVTNINRILDTRQNPTQNHNLEYEIEVGDRKTEIIVINKRLKEILLKTLTPAKDGFNTQFKTLVTAIPNKITAYEDTLTGDSRTFKIEWASKTTGDFTTGGTNGGITGEEIEDYLKNGKYSINKKNAELGLFGAISLFDKHKLTEVTNSIDSTGYFYNSETETITAVEKEIREPTTKELKLAIEILNELVKHFKGNEKVLATVVKYGLISSMSYCYKQAGNWLSWLLLRGQARAGKTALGKIAIFCSGNEPNSQNTMGASGFNTQARIGQVLAVSTDLITVNEPQEIFKKPSTIELIKSAIESPISRGKFVSKRSYRQFPSLAPVILTSNKGIPNDDALLRRLYSISFTVNDKKTPKEIEQFNQIFNIDQPQLSPLKRLKYLNNAVVYEMVNNPKLLFDDWKETINYILRNIYCDVGLNIPSWLLSWAKSESLETYEADLTEEVRAFLIGEFNKARQILNISDETPQTNDQLVNDNIAIEIAEKRLIPYVVKSNDRQGNEFIILKKDLTKPLNTYLDVELNLKGIAELTGWEYKPVLIDGKTTRAIKVPADDFLKFLYPTVTVDEVG